MDDLTAFGTVNFQWTQSLDSVWQDSPYDVPSLNRKARLGVVTKLASMAASKDTGSELGWVFVAAAGFGKTHLLSAIRREALGAGASFVLVDMTDVRDFWETVLLGFIESIQKPVDAEGRTQGQLAVQHLIRQMWGDDGEAFTRDLASLRPPKLVLMMDEIVQRLGRVHRAQTLKHDDVLRALVLLNSDDMDLSSLGHAWLQGYGVGEDAMEKYGFNIREKKKSSVVEGLSWLLGLRSPTVVALDQLDAIVTEHHLLAVASRVPEDDVARQLVSRQIIEGMGRGLMELRDVTRRTLTVVSCLRDTWQNLRQTALQSSTDRYEDPRQLEPLSDAQVAEQLVRARLDEGYRRVGFTPPYPTWPFAPLAFASASGLSPRELLKRCEQHRRACVDEGRVSELSALSGNEPAPVSRAHSLKVFDALDQELERLRAGALAAEIFGPKGEGKLGSILFSGCRYVVDEQVPDPNVDVSVDADTGGGRTFPALHVRVCQVLHAEQDRERHLCVRALSQENPAAFQARLTAAVTASGIERRLPFRKLVLVRNAPPPRGTKTTGLMDKARTDGAELIAASDDDLRTLAALATLHEAQGGRLDAFGQWLRARQPASKLALMKPVVAWLASAQVANASVSSSPAAPQAAPTPEPRRAPDAAPPAATKAPAATPPKAAALPAKEGAQLSLIADAALAVPPPRPVSEASPPPPVATLTIPVGRQMVGERPTTMQTLNAEDLKQHVVVLAGAGSGKTVLLKRLIEEAALLGIPSIIVDGANDLARLGEPWPARPANFTDEDAEKAIRYHARTQVVVWTPGRSNGKPLHLGLLPDFAAVTQDPDELGQAIAMAVDALAAMAGKVDKKSRGILDAALRFFAKQGGGDLATFLDVLADLPPDASLGISTAGKIATALSDSLRAAVQTNPLLHQEGAPLDPGVLFGLGGERTRVSVLSLVGLPGAEAPLQFVNQLAMTLFTWLKKNPCPEGRPLRGLLVLDEAKDFVPSQGTTPCKGSLIRLVAQGRKYGLGVVFATQAPKSIDHNVIANASTQFYGKASSPAAIDAVEEQIRARGGSGSDVARLATGRFYLAAKGQAAPVKIAVPLCLSHHPASPPDEADVLRRAVASRMSLE
jgi:hypothetical protein